MWENFSLDIDSSLMAFIFSNSLWMIIHKPLLRGTDNAMLLVGTSQDLSLILMTKSPTVSN